MPTSHNLDPPAIRSRKRLNEEATLVTSKGGGDERQLEIELVSAKPIIQAYGSFVNYNPVNFKMLITLSGKCPGRAIGI